MTPNEIIKLGIEANELDGKLSDAIRDDFRTMDESFRTELTRELDRRLMGDNRKEITEFIRTKLQPLIKCKSMQKSLIGDKIENNTITIKKVTKPMVENCDTFNESDLGSFRIVVEIKAKPEPKTAIEKLIALMDSENIDTTIVRELLDDIDGGKYK